eukprot:CAMPEP_0206498858 /NCGR_PEP_ID=MMETSP0324_2-20121206/51314_1 /ASSEMBLY_ACC=CAM_ASM_000836 /TAXON_ID=2866 /ORGANISM="Crypthecodinium cohnii, Strain Seligo" /LENGTH=144 /DNA_ID=CAMNT_0053985265 /DNA_START=71 /DNA_END=505 /DNA_ORIENTATION=-
MKHARETRSVLVLQQDPLWRARTSLTRRSISEVNTWSGTSQEIGGPVSNFNVTNAQHRGEMHAPGMPCLLFVAHDDRPAMPSHNIAAFPKGRRPSARRASPRNQEAPLRADLGWYSTSKQESLEVATAQASEAKHRAVVTREAS